jgi:pimeloyl-ACP methyl ester carboxylesterase
VPEGVEERFVPVLGERLRYLHCGRGEPLVLVGGFLGFSFSFSENFAALAQHFEVFAPDLLNLGYSARCRPRCSLRENAEELVAFLDALHLPSAHFIGSSYGATTLLPLAALYPERVRKLVLVSPPGPFSEGSRRTIQLFNSPLAGLAAAITAYAPAPLRRWMLTRVYADPGRARPGTMEEYLKPARIRGTIPHLLQGVRRWKQDFDELEQLLPRVKGVPMLLVWGERDLVVSPRSGRLLHQALPASRLAMIPDAGHLPYEELPEEFNRVVLEYLLREAD